MPRSNFPLFVVTVAVIAGWVWRILYERFPTWQPLIFLVGLAVVTGLAEWLVSRVNRKPPT